MSASNPTAHSAVSPANDIWHQHERQIRDLYQDKKKTLKEVKQEMEKNGFPKKPLSTWESKLRVDLKIRKKNKASDWKLVYRHLTPRLERPGKKRLGKPTIIRLDGRDIPFDEAWKEIRRSGAHVLSPRQLPQGDLPCGVEVRTPSPDLSQRSPTENLASSVAPVVPTSSGSTAALQLYASQTVIAGGPLRITSTVSVFSNDLPTTPWVSLCLNLRHVFHDSIPLQLHAAWESLEWWKIIPVGRSLVAQEIENFQSRLDLLPTSSLRIPRPSPDLGHRLVSSRGNISLSDFVSTSIYLLSNRLHDSNDGDRGLYLLCLLFEHDVHVFTQVLQCEQSTGRATWEALVEYSQYHHNKQIFKYLLEIGIRYEWTDRYDFGVLVDALDMDCPTHVVVSILDYLLDSSHISWRDILDAISIALEKRQVEIARLLVRRFDINAELACGRLIQLLPPRSVFLAFILGFDSTCDSNWHALDFFLSNGADVDQFLPSTLFTREPSRDWYNRNEIHRALRPTILDHSFGINRSLFKTLSQHSKVSESTLTKSGLLTSLEEGLDAFRDYLKTRVSATHLLSWRFMREPLEFLLGDHVHHEWRQIKRFGRYFRTYDFSETLKMDLRIIRSLIEYDEDFSSHSMFLPHTHDILDVVLRQLRDQITDDRLQLLSILMHKGADVREEHLESAVAKDGIKVLSWLRPRVKNFPAKAAGALAKAALLNNFEAVEFLLQSGVDPNSYISTRTAKLLKPRRFFIKNVSRGSMEKTYSVQAIAAGVGKRNPSRFDPDMRFDYSSLKMCQVLAEKGAKLVVGPNDNTPFAFTELLFENGSGDTELFAKVKFALSTSKQSKQWESPPAFLLELCFVQLISTKAEEMEERVKIFEYILSEGADVNPGSPLAALVAAGAPKELVERVLSLGAKLNNYTAVTCPGSSWRFDTKTPLQAAASRGNEDLIYLFLEAGADVNSPARGKRGKTALQAICDWSPATEKEHRRKMTICDILLNGGADVNAAPARRDGCTALQYAASSGDLELTAMLIRHGAHVNAPPDFIGCSALDGAASWGRLDVVKLLLDANALSASRISTGYDGSIFMAECSGHHAIACLIRNHLANALGPGSSFVTSSFEEDAEDDHTHDSDSDSGSTENGSSDDEYRRSEYEFSTDDYWNSVDEESSECEAGEDSDHSASQPDSLMRPAPAVGPADAQVVPDLQAVENILTDDFMGYLGTEFDLTADGVNLQWGCEPMPGSPTGPLTEILDTQAFPGLQIAADAPTNDWAGYPDTGFVFPEEDMQTQWENESMFPFETLVGMPDDSALWQQVFEMQDQELGFATSDAGLQMSASDQLGRPDPERQDIAEQNCIPELQGDEDQTTHALTQAIQLQARSTASMNL